MNIFTWPLKNSALAVTSGFLLFLSFPKYGNGIVAWVAVIPLFFALQQVKAGEGFKLGFLAGIVAHTGILYWIANVVVQYGYLPLYLGIAAMFMLAVYLSIYTALFSMGVVILRERGIPLVLSAPLLWTILEYSRSQLFTGFPWENLAYSQYLFGIIIQIADITGIYGISFTIVMINAALYDFLAFSGKKKRYLLVEAVMVCVVIAVILGYGYFRIAYIEKLSNNEKHLDVALIQGNIDQNIKWNSLYQAKTIDIYRSLSLASGISPGGLIVWPETAAPFYFQRHDDFQSQVVDIAKTTGSMLLFGSPSYDEEKGNIYFRNSAFLLNPDGSQSGRYDKVHLVPYGEYVPLRRLFPFIGKLVAGVGDFRSGNLFTPLLSKERSLGVLICYEGIFPEASRDYKKARAEVLVNITNDAWFGDSSAPYQHLSMTVFRAVENRLSLVRAANTGISAIIAPTGLIISRTQIFERSILKGSVKIIDAKTFYAAYGDAFVYLCGIVLFIIYIFTMQRRRKHAGRNS
jgi:apolipoprotein N-acyltransferase